MTVPAIKVARRRTRTYDANRDNVTEVIPGLQTEIDGKANLVHTHLSTDITDSTAAGRAILIAADAATQKTILGLSAVASSGAFGDLTGKPTTVGGYGITDAVTLTGTETLTGKTLDLASNTLTATVAQINAAISDGDVATIAGTETLTSKTLTLPKITAGTLASLGGAAAAGTEAYITDSNVAHATNSGTVAVGGGSVFLKVYSDGTDWRVM